MRLYQHFACMVAQTDRQTDRWTESEAYEPTVQYAQVGSKMGKLWSPGSLSRAESLSGPRPFSGPGSNTGPESGPGPEISGDVTGDV